MGVIRIYYHAIQIKECADNIFKDSSKGLSRIYTQVLGSLL